MDLDDDFIRTLQATLILGGRYLDPVNRERDLYLADLIDVDELDRRIGVVLGVNR